MSIHQTDRQTKKLPEGAFYHKDPIEGLQKDLDGYLENEAEFVFSAESIQELANLLGIAPEILQATVDEYNAMCQAGEDTVFFKDPSLLRAVKTPPYYAVKETGSFIGTTGGVRVDERFRVISSEATVIPGLYCAGMDAGGFYGDNYNFDDPGCCSGLNLTSAKLVAEEVASLINS
jgi:fumarate reductase flavoprotein subunit